MLVLPAIDSNFLWPGKVQSLVYRIHEIMKDRIGSRRSMRIYELVHKWSYTLFQEFHNYRISSDFRQTGFGEIGEVITLLLETNTNRWSIDIHVNSHITECCDVHSQNDNWKINGINIFNVTYDFNQEGFTVEAVFNSAGISRDMFNEFNEITNQVLNNISSRSAELKKSEFDETKTKILEMAEFIKKIDK